MTNPRKKPEQTEHRCDISDKDKANILRLHSEGLSQRDIGRQLGISRLTIRQVVHAAGGSFDQSATALATKARTEQLRAVRAQFAEELLFAALDMHERAWQKHQYYERTADSLVPVELPLPPMRDQRDAYQSIEATMRVHDRLMASLTGHTTDNVKDVLVNLMDGITKMVDQDKQQQAGES